MISKVRELLSNYRPKNVTGGATIYPLMVLFLLNTVDEFDSQAFNVLSPNIRDHFGLNLTGIAGLVSVVGIADLLLGLPVGYFADRIKRTRMAGAGAATWGAFTLLTAFAPSVAVMGLARAGSGLGKTVNSPTHNSLLSDYYPVSVRPNVYGFHRIANSIGQSIGPIAAGLLAAAFSWRVPFLVFAIPTFVLFFFALRLREPVRGQQDRAAMGASGATLSTPEQPPSYAEAWRVLWQVRTLRRIWFSLPFLTVSFVGIGFLINIFLEEEFGVQEAQRGFLAALDEPFQIVALMVGIPLANRLLNRNPARAMWFQGVILGAVAGAWGILVIAPNLLIFTIARTMVQIFIVLLVPSILAALSLAIPAKVRAMGFGATRVWVVPGLLVLPIIGALGDRFGIRPAMTLMIPVFVIGAFIIASSGAHINSDIAKVRSATTAMSEVRAARDRGETKLLLVKDLEVSYDRVKVLFGVDFEVDEGEIVALLGTNGAGKSTLLKAISGLVGAEAGAIIFDGRNLTYMPPNEIAAQGIMQVPGGRGIFPTLTVEENMKAASWLFRKDSKYLDEAIDRVLGYFPVLRERWNTPAGNMSGGEQQMLTLGMAFIAKPKLLMIDELSLGLAPVIVGQLLEIVKAIQEQGTTIILVEQSVNVALTVAQTAYFMEKGEIRFHGPTRELLERGDILRSVFLEGAASVTGTEGVERVKKVRVSTNGGPDGKVDAEPVLELSGVSRAFGGIKAVDDVSFTLRDGQILGVIGPNGAGKTSLFDIISGFLPTDSGEIVLHGEDITHLPPDVRAQAGLGRSFQDALLVPALTVAENIAIAFERQVKTRDPLAAALNLPAVSDSEKEIRDHVEELIELMGLGAFRDKFVSELSTGSRRIVDLACVLAHKPTVLLFDEPSSGIAQRETEALGPLLLRVREATGSALLVIEHDMPLVTSIADEIIALDLGRVVTQGLPREVVNHPRVVASYLGTEEEFIARSGALAGAGNPKGSRGRNKKTAGR